MSSILQSPTTATGASAHTAAATFRNTHGPLFELERAYEIAKSEASFQAQLQSFCLKNFAGRRRRSIRIAPDRASLRSPYLSGSAKTSSHTRRAQNQQRYRPGPARLKMGTAQSSPKLVQASTVWPPETIRPRI